MEREHRVPGRTHRSDDPEAEAVVGKQTLTEQMILQARAGGGSSLDGELRGELEGALGTSLDDVRLHATPAADAAARAVDADAFAYGQDVFFAGGRPDAATPQGRSLIAHEVAHTVQQRGARGEAAPAVSSPGDDHEVEAEQFASAFVVGSTAPITPVRAGSVARRAIARQATGTQPPPPAPRREEPPEAFTIQPASNLATIGPAIYRVPGAERPAPGGKYVCRWTIELDGRAPGIRERRHVVEGRWNTPMEMIPWRWTVEGQHKVSCDVRWERDQNASHGARDVPQPPARHLELAVQVRRMEDISRERFESTARTDAYFDARLRDMVPDARSRSGETVVDDPREAAERPRRVAAQQQASDTIEPGRQVIARAQLTMRQTLQTMPLAIALGPARGQPGKISLLDFTTGRGRIEIGVASSTAEAIEQLRVRNSYPAGLVEIDVPQNEVGVQPIHTTFEATGESSMGAWSSAFGAVGTAGMVGAGIGLVLGAPVTVPLLIIGSIAAGVASAISLVEKLHDAVPDRTGIAIDALGIVSSALGLGSVAAVRSLATVSYMGRTMRVVDITGRLALAADGASVALIAAEGIDEIAQLWGDTSKSENDRLQAIALVVARITANAGLLVASSSAQLRAERQGGASTRERGGGPSHEPPPPPGSDRAGPVPASVVRVAQSPQEVLAAMQAEKQRALNGRVSSREDGSWRQLVDQETAFVRVIGQGELESLIGQNRVNSRRVDAVMRDPVRGNQELMDRITRLEDGTGRRIAREELPVTSGGRQDPVLPISAFAPAETGYTQQLMAGGSFLVKFKQTVRRVASQNQDLRETEYFIPLWYRLEEVEWIADVRGNRWLYGQPGRAGTFEEAAALRTALGLDARPVPAARTPLQMPPAVRREEELRSLTRRVLDRARQAAPADRELHAAINDLNGRVDYKVRELQHARQRGTLDEAHAVEEIAALERELAALIDRIAARPGPRAR